MEYGTPNSRSRGSTTTSSAVHLSYLHVTTGLSDPIVSTRFTFSSYLRTLFAYARRNDSLPLYPPTPLPHIHFPPLHANPVSS